MSAYTGPWQGTVALAPLELPLDVTAHLEKTFAEIGKTPFDWPHLTLVQFSDPNLLRPVAQGLACLAQTQAPLQLQINGADELEGTTSHRKVVVLEVRKTPDLVHLQRYVAALAGPEVRDVYLSEAWRPHLSVLYAEESYPALVKRLQTLTFCLEASYLSLRDWTGPEQLFALEATDSRG